LSRAVAKLAGITFRHLAFSYWIDNLGFITEGKLAAIFIEPSLGVSNWPVIYFINYTPTSSLAPFVTAPSITHTWMGESWMVDVGTSVMMVMKISSKSPSRQGAKTEFLVLNRGF
jgi:hypothetical protein